LFFQPFFMLSGFTFPIRNMPTLAQYLTFLNPVRYFMEIVRGVFLQGAGIESLWPQMVALAFFGVTILWLSVQRLTVGLAAPARYPELRSPCRSPRNPK
jgi:ABC-2 type transport system permease protein